MTMTQKVSDNSNCKHNPIESNGMVVCNKCGLVLDKIYVQHGIFNNNDHMIYHSKVDKFIADKARTYIGYPSNNMFIQSCMEAAREKVYMKQKDILRLTYRNFESGGLYVERKFEMIASRLDLSKKIKDDIIILYRNILRKNDVKNMVTLLGVCIYDICKLYNLGHIKLRDICKVFKEAGSRMNGHLIIQACLKYNKFMSNKGVSYNKYIDYLLNTIINNEKFEIRLIEKGYTVSRKTIEKKLRKYTYQICERYPIELRQNINPYNFTASAIYAASKIVAFRMRGKSILTQDQICEFTDISAYSVRDLYIRYLKPILKRDGIV